MAVVSPRAEQQPRGWRKRAWVGFQDTRGTQDRARAVGIVTPYTLRLLFLRLCFALPFTVSAKQHTRLP